MNLEECLKLRKEARTKHADWRSEAEDLYKFYAGDQWPAEDKARLEEQRRPIVTFNRIAPFIDAVIGSEINDRKEVRYLPRTNDDTGVTDLFTAAASWVRDQCDAEDEESQAFRDACITGMGWTETYVDYEQDPEGKIIVERVPPLEMEWDAEARKECLSDATWIAREKWMRKDDIMERWPNAELYPETEEIFDEVGDEHDASRAWQYKNDTAWYNSKEGKFRVVHYQYRIREKYYKVIDPVTGDVEELKKERFEAIKDKLDESETPYVPLTRWCYRQKFIIAKKAVEDSKIPGEGFTFQAITGKHEEETNTWYGILRTMRDPQMWANKFFSQFMHIINSNSKGGLLAEATAFENPRKAEEQWASPDSVIMLAEGGLGKIKEREMNKLPSGVDRMLQFAISAIPDTSGINLELMGMVQREQAGVLEAQRKQSAMTILAPLFNALRRYRKQQGRVLLTFINTFIADNRLIRIKGEDGQKFVPLAKMPETVKFDVIVDQAASSPNLKQETWMMLQNVLPAAMKAGIPIPPELLEFTPLPESLVTKWKEFIKGQNKVPPQVQQQMQQMQDAIKKLNEENQKLKNKSDEKMAEIQADHQAAMAELAAERERDAAKLAMEREKFYQELQFEKEKAEAELELKYQVQEVELKLKARQQAA